MGIGHTASRASVGFARTYLGFTEEVVDAIYVM